MRVAAASFTAERGHNSGALIEVYTKSGSNELHGTLSEFHTNNQFTSRTVFQNSVPVFRRNEFGFTAGGPVIKNKTFLFGSYHRLASSASQTDVVPVETPQFLSFLKQNYSNNISTKDSEHRGAGFLSDFGVPYGSRYSSTHAWPDSGTGFLVPYYAGSWDGEHQ